MVHAGRAAEKGALLAACQADARRYAYRHCQASDVDDAVQEPSGLANRPGRSSVACIVPANRCARPCWVPHPEEHERYDRRR